MFPEFWYQVPKKLTGLKKLPIFSSYYRLTLQVFPHFYPKNYIIFPGANHHFYMVNPKFNPFYMANPM